MALFAALVASAVSGTFCVRLFRRWGRGERRHPALLAWAISLGMFSVASVALLVGVVVGWSSPVFRVFYLFGTVLNVPWLALGTILANARDPWTTRGVGVVAGLAGVAHLPGVLRGDPLAITGAVLAFVLAAVHWAPDVDRVRVAASLAVLVFTLLAAGTVVVADLVAPLPTTGLPEGRELFGDGPRSFAVAGTAVGSLVVIVGTLVASGRLMWMTLGERRRRELARGGPRRFVDAAARGVVEGWRAVAGARLDHVVRGNLLIMVGVVVAASSGGMFWFLGDTTAHAVGLGVGVVAMSTGLARAARPRARWIPGPVPPAGR